jgi:hypothetical protein
MEDCGDEVGRAAVERLWRALPLDEPLGDPRQEDLGTRASARPSCYRREKWMLTFPLHGRFA